MAITAWSAKVLRRAICLSENGRTSVRRIRIAPMGTPSRSNGVARTVRVPVVLDGASGKLGFRLCLILCHGRESFADRSRLGLTGKPRLMGCKAPEEAWDRHRATIKRPSSVYAIDLSVQSHHTAARHSRQPHPSPAERPSANWRSRAGSRSWPSAAPEPR